MASLSAGLLHEHLQRDAPLREKTVARFMAGICAVSGVLALALIPLIGVKLGAGLGALLLCLSGWYFAVTRLISRGWFHPYVAWVNVAIEVSAPSIIFLIDLKMKGAAYALTAPPLVIWGTLVALSGLRGDRRLALAAGAIAAVEYTLLYVFLARPQLGEDALVTLQPELFATRVVLLFSSAVFTAAFVRILNKRAEEALAAVRAKDIFGKYLLHERIGAGGMAEVFRATYNPEGGFEKVVALKRVLPQYAADDGFIGMFRDEAALCSQFSHPGVIQVFDFGRFGDTYFLAMEYVKGAPLNRVLRVVHGVGLPEGAVVHLAYSLCEALQYLHNRRDVEGRRMNLIHRDVNPPNILISTQGEVKLTDFGIARAAGQLQLTEVGLVKGKPGYMAPEQAAGEDIDGRVDLFALGVTLWECIAGQPLFETRSDASMMREVFSKEIPPPVVMREGISQGLSEVVMGLLARDVSARTPSAMAALRQLEPLRAQHPQGGKQLAAQVNEALRVQTPHLPPHATPREAPTIPAARVN